MKNSPIRYHFLVALVLMVQAVAVRAHGNEIIVSNNETSVECRARNPQHPVTKSVGDQLSSGDAVLMAEDMRCRQCRGKCAADNLRCRSQCLGDEACLVQCDEQKMTCEATCKQLFTCE